MRPRSDFHRNRTKADGLQTKCKFCRKSYTRSYESSRNSQLKCNFGITLEEYDQMLADQGGLCAICRTDTPGGKGSFHVDHCHETGKVRGLLCHHCNTGLGKFRDRPEYLFAAARYLLEA